jgi:hypothetical protein
MKFMESFLANRPKAGAAESDGVLPPIEEVPYRDLLDGDDTFGGGVSRTGGFQSLRSALLEAGNVVEPRNEITPDPPAVEGHSIPEALESPTVEVVTNAGRIDKIVVTCTCCRRIELDCTY